MKESSIRHKKLYLEALLLDAEAEEVEGIYSKCKVEFLKEVGEGSLNMPGAKLTNAAESLNRGLGKVGEEGFKKQDVLLKPVYRKIMLKTHPDKLIGIGDLQIKEFYEDICSQARRAMDDGCWFNLFDSAKKLNLKNIEVNDEHIKRMREHCASAQDKILKRKNTLPWIWFHSSGDIKKKCIKQYMRNIT